MLQWRDNTIRRDAKTLEEACAIRVRTGQEITEYFERALELNPNLSGVRSHRDAVRDELARLGRHET